ncbi:hypothetical protein NKR23_g3636 [Pleurostoma richardsiae]|uniref:Uncharacterized protein n=1 Tax=Pleurostoma richardsiae TaxID=41990 RepID=A0AA38VLE0_9PEZI|nr:hypothetical protein NKR23_g3636 [Pleurostoma richardsiae]
MASESQYKTITMQVIADQTEAHVKQLLSARRQDSSFTRETEEDQRQQGKVPIPFKQGEVGLITVDRWNATGPDGSLKQYVRVVIYECRDLGWQPTRRGVIEASKIKLHKSMSKSLTARGVLARPHGINQAVHKIVNSKAAKDEEMPFKIFVHALFQAVLESRSTREDGQEDSSLTVILGESQFRLLNENKNEIVDTLIQGFKSAGTLKFFSTRLPSAQEVWDSFRRTTFANVKEFADRVVIYLNIYKSRDGAIALWATYGGITKKLYNRAVNNATGHRISIEGEELPRRGVNHYAITRNYIRELGGEWANFPMMVFDGANTPIFRFHGFQEWAENLIILLFGGFNDMFYGDESPEGKTLIWARHASCVQFFKSCYDATVAAPGLSGFKMSQIPTGCNFSSPLRDVASGERTEWLRYLIRNASGQPWMWQFHRPPLRIRAQGETLIVWIGMLDLHVQLHPQADWGVQAGQEVSVVFEVMVNNVSHPVPWFMIPLIGPYDCWDEALRLGVRLVWEKGGKWKTAYFTRKQVNHKDDVSWNLAIACLAALLGYKWTPKAPKDIPKSGVYRRAVDFDFLERKLKFSALGSVSHPAPRRLKMTETGAALKRAYPGAAIGHMPPNSPPNMLCDACQLHNMQDWNTRIQRLSSLNYVIDRQSVPRDIERPDIMELFGGEEGDNLDED